MTRFARAQGSKASNVRTPEDSTPWEVMQEQIQQSKKEKEETKKREEAEKQRLENYNKFLQDRKTEKRKAAWCDFPETTAGNKTTPTSFETKIKNKNKNKKHKLQIDSGKEKSTENSDNASNILCDAKKNRSKSVASSDVVSIESNIADFGTDDMSKNKKIKKDKKISDKPIKDKTNVINNNNDNFNESQNSKKKKLKKLNGTPTRRKAVNDNSFELIINGKNIELVRYDGFPIMKKDAEKLEDLKQNMIKKGIPKSEVQRTMKLERRRAEKALARVKREVCYNCRKGGHNLSDCPDLKSRLPGKDVAEGICFKCGSTEHRQFECKVQKDKEFRFATCFVCKEPGHIARQCPDNPKGLYPNGGCCKLCGDVTHLRKDCPTVADKKEETSIKLQTLSANDIEDIDRSVNNPTEQTQRKPKKIRF